jgi:hypothetical protein
VCSICKKDYWTHVFLTKQLIAKDVCRLFLGNGWFQQDSATAPTAHISMQALSDIFKDRIVGSGIWSAHSSNLNPCDFFLWGCLKDKVYNRNP